MNGYKTYAAAVLAIVFAVSGALLGQHDWNTAAAFVLPALGAIGIGHKLEKIRQPLENLAELIEEE